MKAAQKLNNKKNSVSADKLKKILYIEDEKALLLVMSNKLKNYGFAVSTATNGIEGMAKIKKEKPKLVLLDLILPNKDGWEILTEMRKDKLLQKIPVIVMTNLGQDSDIEKSLKLGAIDYIIKSDFSINEVVEKIRKYVK